MAIDPGEPRKGLVVKPRGPEKGIRPIRRGSGFAGARRRFPDDYILSAQARRHGQIFLDYLRNGRGTAAIGTWSPRAREGIPIAAPVTWTAVEAGIPPTPSR
jgi:hypothetical protein